MDSEDTEDNEDTEDTEDRDARRLDEADEAPPIPVAPGDLAPDTLRAVIESFVLREGTDYGLHEVELNDKVAQVLGQLERREAYVVFDPSTGSISIVPARALPGSV